MRISICLFFVVIINFSCQTNANTSCKDLRTGNFTIHAESNNLTYSITRGLKKQVEVEQETGNRSEWTIRWLSDCEYELTLVKDNFGLLASGKKVPAFTYKITAVTKDYYIFETSFSPALPLVKDTIFKAK